MYKLYKDNFTGYEAVIHTENNSYIPKDESNKDYQAYLKWLAEGNTPEAADAATLPAENA